ncbi:unnamed protein product [Rotaria socialis]|uniref:glycogenin glucosyltransferase n=1 Tax=Rotaria socialis TaxID=392032 RepID=A0A821M040_9BILA|nr:unnamed protein product [Rotaria socialis]CAF4758146.1 unnamed protein product [Rotaria socialis]
MLSEAFVTLVTNDGYALGALVLAQSIRQVGTKRNLVVMISKHLSNSLRKILEINFDEVILVDEFDSNDTEHLSLLSRPELGITFTKINCWLLEQYSKCVFLDSDCVVLRQIDDLFEREELSAVPDAGWPDCFNSGLFVYRPSKETFRKLIKYASEKDASFDGGDQGLLNEFFSSWGSSDISRHLPFVYNVTSNAFYSYLPAVTRFRNDIRIIHFAGTLKPWHLTYNPKDEQLSGNLNGQNDIQRELLLSWWRIMYQRVWPQLSKLNQGESIGTLDYNSLSNNQIIETGSAEHRRAWESGHIEYSGRDSFSNIQQQIERNLSHLPPEYHPSQERLKISKKPTSILKKSTKEISTTNLNENIQSLVSLNISNEKRSKKSEHESNETVKSTIATAYTQGTGEFTGPTVVSKMISESFASSSGNIANIRSNQQNTNDEAAIQSAISSPPTIIHNEKTMKK